MGELESTGVGSEAGRRQGILAVGGSGFGSSSFRSARLWVVVFN